ncbi:ISL3 family transposase [Lacrimispora brassicae]
MPAIVDKSLITKVCVDDFAFRKRYTYGTVMVDLESHRIIDIIDSRETKNVEKWLRTYPNLQVISRDGAQTYSSAATNSHPRALQISDRFHLLKNLSEVAEKYMRRLFPSRLVIPSTITQNAQMQALYNTRNRSERIRFARKKRSEGYTVNDIALLLHSATTTINRYLAIPEDEIPELQENVMERKHIQQMEKKKAAIEEVRKLYSQGHTADEISRLTGHTWKTVTNYLKDNCLLNNGHYDLRLPGKLAPYEQTVIEMRSKGFTYSKIHEYITEKGYTGTLASLRVFMQKERTHRQRVEKQFTEPVEYIPRKFMCQLIYRELEDVKGLTQDQYEAALKKYPILGKLYTLLKEFHRIVFSQKSSELDAWIETASTLQVDELESYIVGLKKDLIAVKNGIDHKYNNGLAEGSVNKIKLAKRIMYGRNSFLLLKAKLLLNEHFYQIN